MVHILKSQLMNSLRGPLFKKARHAPRPEAPVSLASAQAARYKDPRVDILVLRRRDPGHEGELYLKTRLYSHVMPNRIMEGVIEIKGKSQREIAEMVGATVGVSAEKFAEQYGDTVDPSAAAKVALDNLRRLFDEWDRKVG